MPPEKLDDKSVFNAARELDSAGDRQAYLLRICGDDLAQLERVTDLLCGFEADSQFLESPMDDLQPTAITDETAFVSPVIERPGTQIGPYIIREQLGEGGMGVVYVAEQKEPVRRKVALKIIKPGMDSAEVLARFNAERQALAMMSHPNIAKILDGGSTETGRPYFVMELVKGVTITKFCDQQKLDLRERLELFVTVCQAVQHAHLKGIIHRDLKPSNVLVELHDVAAMPKVIDFGVAKATNHQLTQQTIYTQYAQLIGTPLYMSPEQAQLSGLDIDTRSDVYSLGVVLYELLTGSTPFDKDVLSSAGFDEMRRIIREDEPARPSYRISTLKAEQQTTLSEQFRTGTPQLQRQVERELDWIVMKALEKDRTRRYESASALAADIQRHLNDEPVEACPPSTIYQLRKLARRNKTAIVTISLVAASLIVGMSVSIWQASEAIEAREIADRRLVEADRQRVSAVRAAKLAQQNEEYSRQLVYAADVRLAAQAFQTGDVSRFTELLDRHSPMAGETDRRGFVWRYLRQFGAASFTTIATNTGGGAVIRFSPDGKYLITGRHDGTICFWDGQDFELLAKLRVHEGLVRGVDFSPDGSQMASIGDDGMIRLWNLSEQELTRSFQAHPAHGFRVFFVMNGKVLASCGEGSSVKLWNAATGEAVDELANYARTVERAAMDRSPDGLFCASGDPNGSAYVWDTQTHKRRCRLDLGVCNGLVCSACCVCFSPDGKLVAVATNRNLIRLCDAQTGQQVATFTGHEDDIQDVVFHPSGNLLASSDMAGVIRTWPIDEGKEEDKHESGGTTQWPPSFQAHSARIFSLDFSPDGTRLVSTSNDGDVRSWSGRERIRKDIVDTKTVKSLTFVSDGSELLIAGENNIRTWNRQADELRPFSETFAKDEGAWCVAVSPDGKTCVTGHTAGITRFWSRATGRLIKTLTGHEDDVEQIAFSPDGLVLATGSWDGTAKLWDIVSGKQLCVFKMPPHCYDLAFSPNGRLLACSSENDAMLFDIASRKRLHLLRGHKNQADCVEFSPDGRLLATGSHDRTIRIWSVATGQVKHVIAAHRDAIDSLTFSPSGRTIASGGQNGTIAFSHVETGRFLFDTKVGNDRVRRLQFSPDGKTLAAALSDEGVVLLHAPQTDTSRLKSSPTGGRHAP